MMAHVLIVEDEPFFARMCVRALERPNRQIETVLDGKQAIDAIAVKRPDVIILDLLLPRRDGFEVLEFLRDNRFQVPVIVLSNIGFSESSDVCKDFGVRHYCIKSDTSLRELQLLVEQELSDESKQVAA